MLPLAGLSPVGGKAVAAKFEGGLLSSDGGVLALRRWSDASGSPIVWPPASQIAAASTASFLLRRT